jgi:hypothetical protein
MNRPEFSIEPERYEFFEGLENLEATRREFFRIAGGGVIVALLLGDEEALAQRKGGQFGGGGPQEIGAWIHVGEDGAITAYSGKVEIGQNVRTSSCGCRSRPSGWNWPTRTRCRSTWARSAA